MLELVPADVVLKSGRHISDSDAAAAEMSFVRWQLILSQYHIPVKKSLLDQRFADRLIHVLKLCLRPTIGKNKHTILSWWH